MGERIFEYILTVREKTISARWQFHDADGVKIENETAEQDIESDPLRTQTIKILRDWLSRWGVLSRLRETYEGLPVPGTFKVLGEHLYRLVFTGDVATAFDRVYDAASDQGETLRVVLNFELSEEQGPDELAGYPWEFLYRPGPDGFFIAAQTRFVLSRWVAQGPGRAKMPEDPPPLRVWFFMLTPALAGFEAEHQELLMTFSEIGDYRGALRPRLHPRLTEEKIRAELREADDPPHIIHVVAVCRTARPNGEGKFEIAFQDDRGRVVWRDQDTLVGLLAEAIRPGWTPRMVVLHLCETTAVDYSATFGNLAPKLAREKFPAVLAMQYPLPAAQAKRFTSSFYQLLAEGWQIGDAVQHAREAFHHAADADRLFGAPVLYLQTVDGRLVRTANAGPAVTPADVLPAVPRDSAALIDALWRTAIVEAPEPEVGARVAQEVRDTAWPAETAHWERIIRQWWYAEDDVQAVQHLYRAMIRLVAPEPGGAA
ncbi:CHAT domain-containing protein [Nucisporomicrobium flavum]|uniref:CHAT domain-containing protein n=1 Tax=Nucisporomicrobium flavum TaxID=2785915 RepID=UPI003C2B8FBB